MPGPNSPYTKLDANQVLKQVYDEANDELRVNASVTIGDVIIDIDQASDSIRVGDGTDLVTATVDGAKVGLDVSVMNDAYNSAYNQAIFGVTTSQVDLTPFPPANRRLVIFHNDGAETVFYGPTGVAASTSMPLLPGQTASLALGPSIHLFAITLSGSSNVRVQELA